MSCIQPMQCEYQRRDENAAADAGDAATKPMIAPAMIDDPKGGCRGASSSVAAAERADLTICLSNGHAPSRR
jgi:hypothetical protein